jgi:hypothetical protein
MSNACQNRLKQNSLRLTIGLKPSVITWTIMTSNQKRPMVTCSPCVPTSVKNADRNALRDGVVFGVLAGYTYWFPKAFGFTLDERLGKAIFWCPLLGWAISRAATNFHRSVAGSSIADNREPPSLAEARCRCRYGHRHDFLNG